MHRDEEKACIGEKFSDGRWVSAKVGKDNETSDFRRPIVVVSNSQSLVHHIGVEGLRIVLILKDVEVDVGGTVGSVLRVEHGRTGNITGRCIFGDKGEGSF